MTVSRKWVGQVRAAVADLRGSKDAAPTAETEAWRAFDYNHQLLAPVPFEQTPRARATREINRIAMTYGWQSEVARALDRHGAASLASLQDHEIEDLAQHMAQLLDRAMHSCDHDEALPAR